MMGGERLDISVRNARSTAAPHKRDLEALWSALRVLSIAISIGVQDFRGALGGAPDPVPIVIKITCENN
jgi:hypothetical protein